MFKVAEKQPKRAQCDMSIRPAQRQFPANAPPGAARSELAAALATCRHGFMGVGLVSGMVNLLYLPGAFFMLQVYDRVLPSRSVPTLVGLAILAGGLYAFQGFLDLVRNRIFV